MNVGVGALDDLYYRRVWQWMGQAWSVVVEGPIRSFGPNCVLDGPTYCRPPEPYIFEKWWRFVPSTIGTGSGTWYHVADRQNWGVV